MNKRIIIALVGKAGAGKDYFQKFLHQRHEDWHPIVSYTTRPKREGETNGVNYYYITDEEFAEKIMNGDLLEATNFNGWHYGTGKSALSDGINIGVFDPAGFDCLTFDGQEAEDYIVLGYFIECKPKTRLLRQLNRESDPDVNEIIRRYGTDEDDFTDIEHNPYLTIMWNETEEDMEHNIQDIEEAVQHLVDVGHI